MLLWIYVIRLLTPPGTPDFLSSEGKESQPISAAPRSSSLARSTSAVKSSRVCIRNSPTPFLFLFTCSQRVLVQKLDNSKCLCQMFYLHFKHTELLSSG